MPWLIVLVLALASSGCASWQYNRVKPGELHGKLVVQWVDPDKFIFLPDSERPLTFTRYNKDVIAPGVMYTDGGSIPRPLWGFRNYSPWGYAPAYVVHDWLFEMKRCHLPGNEKYDVDEAARVLAEVMKTMMEKDKSVDVDKLTLYAVFEAVRSPIARRRWDSGTCSRPSARGEAVPPPVLPREKPKMEYVIEFPQDRSTTRGASAGRREMHMRELAVGGSFAAAVLLLFLIFVAAGQPGAPDPCIHDTSTGGSNTCWCEDFQVSKIGDPGVRQPFNTWSNLMALLYGGIVGLGVWWTRTRSPGESANRMRSRKVYPLAYICVVIFLGLGSMWFHASITRWGGVVDQISMYTFVSFILACTIVRLFPSNWPDQPIYVGYGVLTLLLTVLAMLFWAMSQSGRPWCNPHAAFQLHGLWHWLAGITSVLLYFYWRHARP